MHYGIVPDPNRSRYMYLDPYPDPDQNPEYTVSQKTGHVLLLMWFCIKDYVGIDGGAQVVFPHGRS